MGLDWRALEALQVHLLLDDIDEAGVARPFKPAEWSADELKRNGWLLPAIRATNPVWLAKLEFAWDFTGATSSAEVSTAIAEDAARVRERAVTAGHVGLFEESPPLAPEIIEFAEPLDIFSDADPAELANPPPGSLPPMIELWARTESRRKGVPYIFAAAAAIGVASSAVGSSLRIAPRVHDEWTEPAALWLALVADPGSAKSPIISAAIDPLRRLDSERGKMDQAKHDAWFAASKKKGKDNPDPGREPLVRRNVVDDVTMERQVRIHADNPRGLLRAPDELFGLFGSLGAYKKGAEGDRSQVLRLFEGKEIIIDRVGNAGSIRADRALMGVVAGTQPDKMKTLSRDLSSDGMLQRFIFILHDGKDRQGIDEPPDRQALDSYASTIRGLATADYVFCPPIRLSADGYAALTKMNSQTASLKSIAATAPAWRGHVEKWGKFLPRIILTFHALEEFSAFGAVDPEKEVSLATVRRAISFARFLLVGHSLRFYETYFGASEAAGEAREIAGFILTKGASLTELTRKTVYDARKDLKGARNLAALLAAMAELENAEWCTVTARHPDGPTRWRVNPKVHDRFDERAIRERTNRAERRRRIEEAGKQRREWSRIDSEAENDAETAFEGPK